MRIVIVEDEPQIRDGLEKAIKCYTTYEVVGTASNGEKGLALVKQENPDLIITDIRMPHMDGLEMLKYLYDETVKVNAIILTGFSEFAYAQAAIRYGVLEYLLKPIDMMKMVEVLKQIEMRLMQYKKEIVSVQQLLLNMMISDDAKAIELEEQIKERLSLKCTTLVDLFLIKPTRIEREIYDELIQILSHKLELQFVDNYQIYKLSNEYGILVCIIDVHPNQNLKRLFESKILPNLYTLASCSITYCRYTQEYSLRECIIDLKQLFQYTFSCETTKVLNKEYISQLNFESLKYPRDIENNLKGAIYSRDEEKIKKYYNQFVETIIYSRGKPEEIKEYTAKMAYKLYGMIQEYGLGGQLEFSIQYLSKMMLDSNNKQELVKYLDKIKILLIESERKEVETENFIILRAIGLIRRYYQDDLTLAQVADEVGVTPEYLSKLFVKEININFVSFLRNFRISVAKRMLDSNKYKVFEIAEQVGFRDVKYFNKVFKSVCGVSPLEYKKRNVRKNICP
ncbi:MAG: response regulator [Cellulosilyticum sp.]|nr:response regulator [Cellulosilyticum sp.]